MVLNEPDAILGRLEAYAIHDAVALYNNVPAQVSMWITKLSVVMSVT